MALINLNCQGQINQRDTCNRTGVDKSIEKLLPTGLCIPSDYTVDKVIAGFDFNQDGRKDVAVRYAQYPLSDGVKRYYSVYEAVDDTTYLLKIELPNLSPPYLNNVFFGSLNKDSLAASLVEKYPYDVEVSFLNDTVKVSHSIPDEYGKTYSFVYLEDTWYLQRITYWIGNLDRRYLDRMNLKEELLKKVPLEVILLEDRTKITQFNLAESKNRSTQESEYLVNKYDVFDWVEDY